MTTPQIDGSADPASVIATLRAERDAALVREAALAEALHARTVELRARDSELAERTAHQAAAAEILQAINASAGDLVPVLEAILQRAAHLCDAPCGIFWTYDGEGFRPSAVHGVPPAFAEFLRQTREKPTLSLGAISRGEPFVHNVDLAGGEVYRQRSSPLNIAVVELGLGRTGLLVPLHKDGTLLGAVRIYRHEVRPFTDYQIALLQSFAAQAVIAIENARLLTETREALAQQTAMTEVLQTINRSPGKLEPVFDMMLEKAMQLGKATGGALRSYDADAFHAVAMRGMPATFLEATRVVRPDPRSALGRIERGEHLVQITDMADPDLAPGDALRRRQMIELGGIRTTLWIALRKDAALLGTFVLYRKEVQPFTERQIALVESFAAQAVIATENARLLGELRQRTGDLQEALEYQTVTSDVLKVISRSTFDLRPVLETVVGTAARLCGADVATIAIREGDAYRVMANFGASPGYAGYIQGTLHNADSPTTTGRTVRAARVVHIEDVAADPDFSTLGAVHLNGVHTLLGVPLLRDSIVLGTISLGRKRVERFTERQIELVRTFADQAVIAIENTRLITEQREALERQTATAEVLQVINANPGNLTPVFDAVLEKAIRLCESSFGILHTYDGEAFHNVAARGVTPAFAEFLQAPIRPVPGMTFYRVTHGEDVVHAADIMDDDAYRSGNPARRALVDLGGARTQLLIALRKDDILLGLFNIFRQEVRLFSDEQIALLKNFAAQAVIAMENARLLGEQREALERQTAIAEVLQVINASSGDLAPVFDAIGDRDPAVRGRVRRPHAVRRRSFQGRRPWGRAAGLCRVLLDQPQLWPSTTGFNVRENSGGRKYRARRGRHGR
jgi:GAF domain-containing protein